MEKPADGESDIEEEEFDHEEDVDDMDDIDLDAEAD